MIVAGSSLNMCFYFCRGDDVVGEYIVVDKSKWAVWGQVMSLYCGQAFVVIYMFHCRAFVSECARIIQQHISSNHTQVQGVDSFIRALSNIIEQNNSPT